MTLYQSLSAGVFVRKWLSGFRNTSVEVGIMRRRLFPASIFWTTLILFACPSVSPLDRSSKISQYGHNMWRIQDGYLPGPVEDIAQTKDGYLWIGTALGLLRF